MKLFKKKRGFKTVCMTMLMTRDLNIKGFLE